MSKLSPRTGSEPVYEPTVWNKDLAVRKSHNCYAYAVGQISPSESAICRQKLLAKTRKKCHTPQPGYAAGYPKMRNTPVKECRDIMRRTLDDNMTTTPIEFDTKCPPGTSKIALVVDNDQDYHYYRQDSNGMWSHKPGRDPVTNLDASGNKIADPRGAARDYRSTGSKLNYDKFCGFMCVRRGVAQTITTGGHTRTRRQRRSHRKRLIRPL